MVLLTDKSVNYENDDVNIIATTMQKMMIIKDKYNYNNNNNNDNNNNDNANDNKNVNDSIFMEPRPLSNSIGTRICE